MHKSARVFLGLSLVIAAGQAFAEPVSAVSPPAVIQAEPLTGVLERIRQDVGYYEVQAARWRGDIGAPAQDGGFKPGPQPLPAGLACDVKDIDFDVTNVQLTLQTVTANTGSGSVGLRIPLLGIEGSADGGFSLHADHTQTVALTRRFTYSKEQLSQYQETEDYRRLEAAHQKYRANEPSAKANPVLPISDALIDLHTNLIFAAEKLPCFEWTDKDVKPDSSSVTIEFQVQQAVDADVGFNFLIVSAKAGVTAESTNVNTLVVSFAPHALPPSAVTSEVRQFGEVKVPRDVIVQ